MQREGSARGRACGAGVDAGGVGAGRAADATRFALPAGAHAHSCASVPLRKGPLPQAPARQPPAGARASPTQAPAPRAHPLRRRLPSQAPPSSPRCARAAAPKRPPPRARGATDDVQAARVRTAPPPRARASVSGNPHAVLVLGGAPRACERLRWNVSRETFHAMPPRVRASCPRARACERLHAVAAGDLHALRPPRASVPIGGAIRCDPLAQAFGSGAPSRASAPPRKPPLPQSGQRTMIGSVLTCRSTPPSPDPEEPP